ncbi:transcriptional regulator RpiR family [Clostridium aceticum]|uniref:Transcriptional regulator RpiR family n=1 Tax=Clostridium aceticum TaxID=84022 RepID=A0A0D8I8D7_9CLOT|nr:MurR/RpiR family transcriptional regulator [Clostridium aceticum]AKL97280.1 transcriptional regulator RpiR family [Clostridium aceticum]KJF26302.1 transcriptional regulator, RpiR family protein [Clostridium aceticum]
MIGLDEIDKTKLSKNDHIVLDYLLKNERQLYCESSDEISKKTGISNATISRFWKKIGYTNIKDFQKHMVEKVESTPLSKIKNTLQEIKKRDEDLDGVFIKNIKTIEKTLELLDYNKIDLAADLILLHRKIYVFATDASLGIANIMEYRLRRLGIEFILISGGSSIYEYLININKEDLVIVFCYSRLLSEISIILNEKENIDFSLIIFTDILSHSLHEKCDAFIYSYRGEQAEYHSMVAPMSVVDCLIIKIAMKSEVSVRHLEKLNQLRAQYQGLIKR